MKNTKTKKVLFLSSLTYVILFASAFVLVQSCHAAWCRIHDDDFTGILLFTFLPLLPIFLLSLITYRMRDKVFLAWWNFAKWWVPVIVVVTILMNNSGSGGGYIGMDAEFDGIVYSLLYGPLIIVSMVKIYRAYRKQ